jgi:hypothetical protein
LIVILTPRIIYDRADTQAILAEETRKMDWMWGDVLRQYDLPALQQLAPQKDAGPADGNCEFPEPGPVFTPGGPALGEPIFGEPIPQAPREANPPPSPAPPPPSDRPQPMPDGPAARTDPRPAAVTPRGSQRPAMSNTVTAVPTEVVPRGSRPMPNSP